MFDVAPTEFLLVVVVALVVIGPKDLPKSMRFVGKWMGKARGMARHFRSGLDTMMREAELEELEKQWRQQNEEIMRQFPNKADGSIAHSDGSKPNDSGAASHPDFEAAGKAAPEPSTTADLQDASPQPDVETHKVPPRGGELP